MQSVLQVVVWKQSPDDIIEELDKKKKGTTDHFHDFNLEMALDAFDLFVNKKHNLLNAKLVIQPPNCLQYFCTHLICFYNENLFYWLLQVFIVTDNDAILQM